MYLHLEHLHINAKSKLNGDRIESLSMSRERVSD